MATMTDILSLRLVLDASGWNRALFGAHASFSSFLTQVGRLAVTVGVFGTLAVSIREAFDLSKSAGDFVEDASKFRFTFKEFSDEAERFANDFGAKVGRSRPELIKMLANTQAVLVTIGEARNEAAKFSQRLVELAVDLGSFNNIADTDAMDHLLSGLVGNHRALRALGIGITQSTLQQELYNMGIHKTIQEASDLEKVQGRLSIILRSTTDQQGDAERTLDSFANTMRQFHGIIQEIQVGFGMQLNAAILEVIKNAGGLSMIKTIMEANSVFVARLAIKFVELGAAAAKWVADFIKEHGGIDSVMAQIDAKLALLGQGSMAVLTSLKDVIGSMIRFFIASIGEIDLYFMQVNKNLLQLSLAFEYVKLWAQSFVASVSTVILTLAATVGTVIETLIGVFDIVKLYAIGFIGAISLVFSGMLKVIAEAIRAVSQFSGVFRALANIPGPFQALFAAFDEAGMLDMANQFELTGNKIQRTTVDIFESQITLMEEQFARIPLIWSELGGLIDAAWESSGALDTFARVKDLQQQIADAQYDINYAMENGSPKANALAAAFNQISFSAAAAAASINTATAAVGQFNNVSFPLTSGPEMKTNPYNSNMTSGSGGGHVGWFGVDEEGYSVPYGGERIGGTQWPFEEGNIEGVIGPDGRPFSLFGDGYAQGGYVSGPSGIDALRARLTSGEFVVNRASAQANSDTLQRINASGGRRVGSDGGTYAPSFELHIHGVQQIDDQAVEAKIIPAMKRLMRRGVRPN